jgi:UDP-N-acetylmuramyl pentapeptide phosphotransferase/UDP-N-acetylglucosamine-1-phosphate transferase
MLTIFTSLIVALITGFLILRYQATHQALTGDNDLSGIQKFHRVAVPRIGGLILFLGIFTGVLIRYYDADSQIVAMSIQLLASSIPVFLGGMIEDFTKKVGVKTRLFLIFSSAILAGFTFNAWLTSIQILGIDMLLSVPIISILFTCFAVTGVANAFNLIDGFNGLASGVALMILIAIAYVAFQVRDYAVLLASFAAIGAIIGFIFWNYPKGLIFLGDGGAYLIGFWIAELCVLLCVRNDSVSKWFPLLICIYPIFETLFTMYRRLMRRMHLGSPDASHLHHLFFRRIIVDQANRIGGESIIRDNSRTSPYLWLLASIGVMPAILFWKTTGLLQFFTLLFCLVYVWLYRAIAKFKAPEWLSR